jgi:hypothetical protein
LEEEEEQGEWLLTSEQGEREGREWVENWKLRRWSKGESGSGLV